MNFKVFVILLRLFFHSYNEFWEREEKKIFVKLVQKKERDERQKARERKDLKSKTGYVSVDNERKRKLVKWEEQENKDRSESERWKGKRERERYKTGIDI